MIPQGQQAEPDRADRHTVDPFAALPHEPGEKGDAQGRATVHPSALTRTGGHTGRGVSPHIGRTHYMRHLHAPAPT